MKYIKNILIATLILSAFLFVFVSSSVFGEDKDTFYGKGAEATRITSQVYLTNPEAFRVEHSYDRLETFFIKPDKNQEGCDLDFAREIVPNNNGYYMAGNSEKACVSHYSTETGELESIKLPFVAENPHITSRDLILRSSPNAGKLFVAIPKINRIELFNLRDGAFVESKVVPFNFQSFAPSPDADAYIFYCPMNVYQEGKSVLITDEAFHIDHAFFTPPSILRRANWLASNSFKVYDNKVYFNPPASGDIYELFFDGSMEKVFYGPSVSETLIKDLQSMRGEELLDINYSNEAKKRLPIYDFQVTEDKIAFQYFKDGKYFFTTVVDIETGRAVSHQNAVFLDNIGDHLQYVFLTPSATENGDFLSCASSENISMIHDNVSASVDKASVDFDLALFKFSYNFDELYEQGAKDTEFTSADDEKDEVQQSNLLSNVLAFPNPMNSGDDKLQVRITLSSKKRSSIKKGFVTVQIFSAVSSSVVYEQKYAINQVLSGDALSIDSQNVPTGFSQILVVEEEGEILGSTSVIKME